MASNRTHPSGSTKRKFKRVRDEALARTNPSITTFFHGSKKTKGEQSVVSETGNLASEVLNSGETRAEPGPSGDQPQPAEPAEPEPAKPEPAEPEPDPCERSAQRKPQPGGSGDKSEPDESGVQPIPRPDNPEPGSGDPQFRNDSSEESSLSDNDNGNGKRANGVFCGLNVCSFVCPNPGDPVNVKIAFWKEHPIQVEKLKNGQTLPFDPAKLYYRTLPSGEKIQRKWLSYSEDLNKVFCSSCMAFGDKSHRDSSFVVGHDVSPKHIYKAVESHENAKSHHDAVTAALQACGGGSIEALLFSNLANERVKQVEVRRQVVERLIDIVMFIGRQGLAFRGKDEAAFSLESKGNHGNFLELVLLVAEYDVVLKSHVKQSIAASKERKKKGKIGRGSLLTFLSKTFINKLIKTIARVGLEILVENIKQAGKYSLMVDTTSDVAALNQVAICIRYVHQGQAQERLLQMATVDESTGENLYETVRNELSDLGISLSNMSGCSFDGASNMSSEYKGLQARLKEVNPSLLFTHCMGHCLNLVVCDCTTNSTLAENLFGLVGESASFLNRSYKRMAVWTKTVKRNHSAHGKLRKLKTIGATRWWSKHKALTSIIDFNEKFGPNCKFSTFLSVLIELSTSTTTDCNTKFLARTLIEKWTKFETIMAAMIMSDLFDVTSPVSVLLQSKNLDYLKAFAMVETLLTQIRQKRDDGKFRLLYEKCVAFTRNVETLFGEKIDSIETDFAVRGTGRRSESSYDKVKVV